MFPSPPNDQKLAEPQPRSDVADCFSGVPEIPSTARSRPTRDGASCGTGVQGLFASRRTRGAVSPNDECNTQLSLHCTTMLRKFGKTVREKLDHIESRFSTQESSSVDQPGSHLFSRHGGGHIPPAADFPTQEDFFRFRKQRGVNLGALYAPSYQIGQCI